MNVLYQLTIVLKTQPARTLLDHMYVVVVTVDIFGMVLCVKVKTTACTNRMFVEYMFLRILIAFNEGERILITGPYDSNQ